MFTNECDVIMSQDSPQIVLLDVRDLGLSGGGRIKYAGTKTDHRSYAGGSDYGNGGSLPFLHERNGRARLHTRTTRSDPSLRGTRARKRKDSEKNRTSNSAPTPVKGRRPSNHDRNRRRKAAKSSSQLPKLPTEAHGVPTVKQTRTVPTESSKKWATSWAEVRATTLQRDDIKSPLVSPTSPSPCRTEGTGKTLQTNTTSTSNSSGFQSNSESGKKYDSGPKKDARTSPFYAKSKSEINSSKRKAKPKPQQEPVKKVHPPPLERSKSKIGFFNRQGDFTLQGDGDPHDDFVRSKTVSPILPRHSPPKRSVKSQSAKTLKEMKKPKLRRRPVVITKKTLSHEKSLKSVYGNRSFKLQRHVSFLKQLTEAQKEKMEEENKMEEEKARMRFESWKRQRMELKKIRDRFDEEQVKRFGRQYVSWKSVETDRLNRKSEEYGLPDNIYDDRYDKTLKENLLKAKTDRKPKSFHQVATWMKNIKRFENLLNPKLSTHLERQLQNRNKAIVEGIDTVELTTNGNDLTEPTKNIKVDRVIGSAKKILHTQEMDAISEVSSLEELEDNLKTIALSE